jgi:hypothetical protein
LGLEDRPLPREGSWPRWVPDFDHLDERRSCDRYQFDDNDDRSDDHNNCSYNDDNRFNDDNYRLDNHQHRDVGPNG